MNIKMTIGILFVTGLLLTGMTFFAGDAACQYCPTYDCYGGGCGDGCLCLIPPGELKGRCYSAGLVDSTLQGVDQ